MPNQNAGMAPAVIFETGPLLLAEDSAQKADAIKVADYWMSAPAQQAWVDAQDFPPINKDVKAKSALISDLVKEINDGNYTQINRFWEATPPEIAEAAVDELGGFMLNPDNYPQVHAEPAGAGRQGLGRARSKRAQHGPRQAPPPGTAFTGRTAMAASATYALDASRGGDAFRPHASPRRSRILYVLPAALFVGVFLLYPMVTTLWQGFTRFDGITDPVFIGFDNYRRAVRRPALPHLAPQHADLDRRRGDLPGRPRPVLRPWPQRHVRGAGFFKASIYLPATISAAAVGILFSFIFAFNNGALNSFLRGVGLEELASRWLFEAPLNTFSMIAAYTWQQTGLNLMLFLVGLQGLPHRAHRGGEARRLHRAGAHPPDHRADADALHRHRHAARAWSTASRSST